MNRILTRFVSFSLLPLSLFYAASQVRTLNPKTSASPLKPADAAMRAKMNEAYGNLPLSFEINRGQAAPSIKFISRGVNYNFSLAPTEATLQAQSALADQPATVRMKMINANPSPKIEGLDQLPGKSNYLIGDDPKQWRTDIPNYARAHYDEVWPGVDAVFYGNQRQLEYDFVVSPGADPRAIKLSFEGAKKISVSASGDLILRLAEGELRQRKPVVYQKMNGEKRMISGRYVVKGNQVGFEIGRYDRRRELVIDPTLLYSTNAIGGLDIAVDAAGSAYVLGRISAPNVTGKLVVSKLNVEGSALIYSTTFGGSGDEFGFGIAVDAQGNAYITGNTDSDDLPGALNRIGGGSLFRRAGGASAWSLSAAGLPFTDVLSLAVNPQNTSTLYAGVCGKSAVFKSVDGGSAWAAASAGLPESSCLSAPLIVDPANPDNLYVGLSSRGIYKSSDGGATWRAANTGLPSNYSTRALAIAPSNPATLYAWAGTGRIYKSIDGGEAWREINTGLSEGGEVLTMAVDPANPNVVYAGVRAPARLYKSVDGGGAWTPINNGLSDSGAVSIVIDPKNPATLYVGNGSGVFKSADGGASWSRGSGLPFLHSPETYGFPLAIDPVNPATLYAGIANSTGVNGVYQSLDGGKTWSYFSAGLVNTNISALAIDPQDPSKLYAGTSKPGRDAFAAKLSADGSKVLYSRYLGGGGEDAGSDIVVDGLGRAYLIGGANSADFPTTPDAFQPAPGGGGDAFVSRLNPDGSINYSSYLGGSLNETGSAIALDAQGNLHLIGGTNSIDFPTKDALQTSLAGPNSFDVFVAKLNLNAPGQAGMIYSTYLGGTGPDFASDIAVDAAGASYALFSSVSADLPLTPGAVQTAGSGYLAKLNATGSALVYATYLGSITQLPPPFPPPPPGFPPPSAIIAFNSVAVDSAGNAYLTGSAADKTAFPITPGALQSAHGDANCVPASPHQIAICYDAFVMKLNETGSILLYSSYLGGNGSDNGHGIALDAAGNIYVTGGISSSGFPVTPNALKAAKPNGFVSKIKLEARNTGVTAVSAANYQGPQLAQESLAVGFLDAFGLGAGSLQARVRDSAGTERGAQVFFSNSGQVNFQIPPGTAEGDAAVRIVDSGAVIANGALQVVKIAPGVFAADASGRGLAAAVAQRARADGVVTYEAIFRFDPAQNKFVAIPIDFGPEGDRVFLSLFGTGWRFRSSESAVKVTIGGVDVPVTYAGSQPTFVGLDQINVQLPRTLAGKGEVDVVVTVDGKAANTVNLNIK